MTQHLKCEFCSVGGIHSITTENGLKTWKFDCGSNIQKSNKRNVNVTITNNLCTKSNENKEESLGEVEVAFDDEDLAFKRNSSFIESKAYLIHELIDLYQKLFNIFSIDKNLKKFREAILLQAILTSKHELVKGYFQLLRGHHIDSYGNTRKAIELSIFAARCIENVESAQRWINAANSEEEWDLYRREFRIYELFKIEKSWSKLEALRPQLKNLIQIYDEVSRYIHASIYSTDLIFEPKDDQTIVTFRTMHFKPLSLRESQQQFSLLLKDFVINLDFLFLLIDSLTIPIQSDLLEEKIVLEKEIFDFYDSLKDEIVSNVEL